MNQIGRFVLTNLTVSYTMIGMKKRSDKDVDFRDLETPPALSLALPTKALFLATAIRKAHLDEIPFPFGIPYRAV